MGGNTSTAQIFILTLTGLNEPPPVTSQTLGPANLSYQSSYQGQMQGGRR